MSVSASSQVFSNTASSGEVGSVAQQETCDEERLFSRYRDEKRFNCEGVEYQENVISKSCEKIYTKWKRDGRPFVSLGEQSFSDLSGDGKFTIGLIGEEGGHLELRNGDIQLYIPPGALSDIDEGYVFMYADSVHYNLVKYDVIICGPPGLQFNNSVLLRFPNPKSQDDESSSVKLSVQKLGKPLEWRSLDTPNDGFFFKDDGNIMLHLNHFTGIKVGVQANAVQAKDIQAATADKRQTIFVSTFLEQQNQRYFLLRVYCSTHSALKDVSKTEIRSKQIENPVKIGSFRTQEDDVTLRIKDCEGCQADPSDYSFCVGDVVADVEHIHRQFVLERSNNVEAFVKCQVNVSDKNVHMAGVKIESQTTRTKKLQLLSENEDEFYDECQELKEFTRSPLSRPILTIEMRRELSIELDVLRIIQWTEESKLRCCDYRGLAELMGMSTKFIEWIGAPKNCQKSSSPTILLLDDWEIKCRKEQLMKSDALNELKQYLIQLGHHACIEMITSHIAKNNTKIPSVKRRDKKMSLKKGQRRWTYAAPPSVKHLL